MIFYILIINFEPNININLIIYFIIEQWLDSHDDNYEYGINDCSFSLEFFLNYLLTHFFNNKYNSTSSSSYLN